MNKDHCKVNCDYLLNEVIKKAKEEIGILMEIKADEIKEIKEGGHMPRMIVYTALAKALKRVEPKKQTPQLLPGLWL
jgi:hypothetical protein